MAKDPAFLFYTGDFFTATQFFTDAQVGKYVRLLMAQHQLGHLEEEDFLKLAGTDKKILEKFKKDSEGKFFNERLDFEINKRKKFSDHQRDNVNKRYQKSTKSLPNTYQKVTKALPLENENENEIKNKEEIVDEKLWTSVKNQFFNSWEWQEKFCTDKKIGMENLKIKQKEFISDQELKENYQDLKELKNHFTNWFNKNKKNGYTPTSSNVGKTLIFDKP